MIPIQRDVPVPGKRPPTGTRFADIPFAEMVEGDLVEYPTTQPNRDYCAIKSYIRRNFASLGDLTFVLRRVGAHDDFSGGIGLWLVKSTINKPRPKTKRPKLPSKKININQ